MNRCIYKTLEGNCAIHSDGIEYIEPCLEGPCEDEKFDSDFPINIKPKQTNADRMRNMSDEELAEFLISYKDCNNCIIGKGVKDCHKICDTKTTLVDWIKQEASHEN